MYVMEKTVIDAHNITKVYNPETIPVYAVNNVPLQQPPFAAARRKAVPVVH